MTLSKKQRAEVVELLRVAADLVHETKLPIYRASCQFNETNRSRLEDLAIDARLDVCSDSRMHDDEAYRADILEAAQRVEEGSWP